MKSRLGSHETNLELLKELHVATPTNKTFKVNFSYPAPNGLLRSASMIVAAPDSKTAVDQVNTKLSEQHDVYRITSVREF